jgi:diguanylate cyclase (GGDEF)-like protein
VLETQGFFKQTSDDFEGVINVRKYRPEAAPKTVKIELETFADPTPSVSAESQGSIEEELGAIITDLLATVKETVQARTVAFCWVSQAKKKFYIASHQTDAADFTTDKWLAFGSDAVTQIFLARNAQLYTEISAADEPKIIRYYLAPNAIKAFMGVPVFHRDQIYAVLFADSIEKGAFGHDDVKLLNRFGKICSTLIDNYALKSAYLESMRFAEPAQAFMHTLHATTNLETILNRLCESLTEAVEVDHLALLLLNSKSEMTVRKVRSAQGYISEGAKIDLERSAVGLCILHGEHGAIDDLAQLGETPRFFSGEPAIEKNGSMLILPIRLGDLTAGALVLESGQKSFFTSETFARVRFFAEALTFSMQVMLLDERVRTVTPLDEETNTLSVRTFFSRLRADINRATRLGHDLVLMLIAFDDSDGLKSRYGQASLTQLMRSTARLIEANTRNYDLLARLDNLKFAVCLSGISELNARFWADKIREQILNSPFETDDEYKTIIATVSVGIARLKPDKPDVELLLEQAERALDHARQSGGNVVKIF